MLKLNTTVCGIPCSVTARVVHHPGSRSWNAPSDLDYWGYTDVDFTVLDQRGRPAPWLERKMTDNDVERLEQELLEAYHTQADSPY